jgi:hypothetical protein
MSQFGQRSVESELLGRHVSFEDRIHHECHVNAASINSRFIRREPIVDAVANATRGHHLLRNSAALDRQVINAWKIK